MNRIANRPIRQVQSRKKAPVIFVNGAPATFVEDCAANINWPEAKLCIDSRGKTRSSRERLLELERQSRYGPGRKAQMWQSTITAARTGLRRSRRKFEKR